MTNGMPIRNGDAAKRKRSDDEVVDVTGVHAPKKGKTANELSNGDDVLVVEDSGDGSILID